MFIHCFCRRRVEEFGEAHEGWKLRVGLAGVQVIDGHYPHVMPHSSNLSFWEKGMTSDIGHTWLIGLHKHTQFPCSNTYALCIHPHICICRCSSVPSCRLSVSLQLGLFMFHAIP